MDTIDIDIDEAIARIARDLFDVPARLRWRLIADRRIDLTTGLLAILSLDSRTGVR